MSLIVAARFVTFSEAEHAARRLFERGFIEEDVTLFFVNPRGQHARHPIGGDMDTDPGVSEAPKGAGKGVTLGAVAGAVVGVAIFAAFQAPLLISIIAAGVGAYIGSLVGAMMATRRGGETHQPFSHHESRDSGVLVAVHVNPDTQHMAAQTLRDSGGRDVERATGRWQKGRWSDFDPTVTPTPLDDAPDAVQSPAH
ncbi:hypothetical protein [Paraburkholderia phosphatilytica]|uniref:hypothetical protein n=1 Tax=Paraburkholderia phosphatilytica TaxID=2282883 RepID=UPI000E4EEE65|nr:hypothetical protein [Paraburkholderia phosphatilytica]